MTEAEVEASLAALLAALEEQSTLSRELLDAVKATNDRQADLGDEVLSLNVQLGAVTARSRLLLNMKATTLITTCRRCGNEFANEPGPQLCGPCWKLLGKPDRYLAQVPPEGA